MFDKCQECDILWKMETLFELPANKTGSNSSLKKLHELLQIQVNQEKEKRIKTLIMQPSQKVSEDKIYRLNEDEIFVFGSNLAGVHGAGAAALAKTKFGAKIGVGFGFTGQCYAIPTKDWDIKTMPLRVVGNYIQCFLFDAIQHPHLKFLITQVGCGLAGFTTEQIAPFFFEREVPSNVYLPKAFWNLKN